jgi:hypothetical protein
MQHTRTFTKEKDTKNTVKYAEDAIDGTPLLVGTLYLQKWAAGAAPRLTVTITVVGE